MAQATGPALLTGEAYLQSLRDGRTVYIDGERVDDVTAHPAFRNSARSIARLYDELHDPSSATRSSASTASGSRRTSSSCRATPRRSCSRRGRRSPPGRACRTGSWAGRPTTRRRSWRRSGRRRSSTRPSRRARRRWYRRYAEQALFLNHVLINPPIDRNREVHEVEDVYVHVVKERDDGMVVSGAKMLATGSALTHATFVAQNSAVRLEKGKAEDYALVFIAPMDTPGKTLISRRSYELAALVAVGQSTLEPLRRERRRRRLRRGVHPVGERARLPRRREGDRLLPRVRVHEPLHAAGRNAPRGEARLHAVA